MDEAFAPNLTAMSIKLIPPASLVALLALSACGQIQIPRPGFLDRSPDPVAAPVAEVEPEEGGESVLLAEEEPEATPAPAATVLSPGQSGETVASLGDPTVSGLWLETGLVTTETTGRLTASNGRWVNVTLLPSGGDPGAGSRISVGAMQGLGLNLTDLATITVAVDA